MLLFTENLILLYHLEVKTNRLKLPSGKKNKRRIEF